MSAKRSSNKPVYNDSFSERPLKTTEEFDCERRGYKLTKSCLGTGAYAKVKLAYVTNAKLEKDKRLADELKEKGTNKVAIKIISRKSAPKEYINKFMPREIETLHATYRFPNVIQLYETFRTESRVYLVMEYASKGDLLEHINSRSNKTPGIGETKSKVFFKQLVAGVQHCHRRNVVHRDLKCENILLDEEGEVIKISDFGFATRFPTNKQKLLETFCGSYAYAAPEILQAEKYDGKIADIWSLGVVLFAMINGRLPYNDRDIRTLIEQTKTKPRFSSRVNVTAECQDLVCKILTPNSTKRAGLQDILRHPWMSSDVSPEDKISRGIPDGKSDEIVANENTDDVPKYNLRDSKKVASCLPYTQRVLQRERWMAKVPEPQAIQKLLHSRNTKVSTSNDKVNTEKVSDKITEDGSAKNVLSKFWEDRKNHSKSSKKQLITGVLPNKYQPEPVVTKIAFSGQQAIESSVETTYRLSPSTKYRPKNPPVIMTNAVVSNMKSRDGFLPVSKQKKDITCSLPPVCASTRSSKGKSSSAGSALPHKSGESKKSKVRQSSAQSTKQYQSKPIQNFSFNQPGINIEVINLRRNWQKLKQSSNQSIKEDSKSKSISDNIELTYYTLSGKEVNVKGEKKSRPVSVINGGRKSVMLK